MISKMEWEFFMNPVGIGEKESVEMGDLMGGRFPISLMGKWKNECTKMERKWIKRLMILINE